MHPRFEYNVYAVEKLLGLQWSKYIYDSKIMQKTALTQNLHRKLDTNIANEANDKKEILRYMRRRVWLIAPALEHYNDNYMNSTNDVITKAYLYNPYTHTKHNGLNEDLLFKYRMGPGDVYLVDKNQFHNINNGPDFPILNINSCDVL